MFFGSRQVLGEDADDGDEGVRPGSSECAWPQESAKMRYKLSMPLDSSPWSAAHQLTGLNPKCERTRDIVDVAYWAWLRATSNKIIRANGPKWYVDASQSVERMPWGPEPHSFNKQSLVYSFALDRAFDSEDISEEHCASFRKEFSAEP